MLRVERLAFGRERHGAAEHREELAHVEGPVVAHERHHEAHRELGIGAAEAREQRAHEPQEILLAIAKRRQRDDVPADA